MLIHRDTVTNGQMFYFSTSKYGIRKSILSKSGGYVLKIFLGASPPDPFNLLPHQLIYLYIYNFFTMVEHITQNITESRPHGNCHSFNICHSHTVVSGTYSALHSINCLQRQFVQKLIKIKHYIYIYISENQVP